MSIEPAGSAGDFIRSNPPIADQTKRACRAYRAGYMAAARGKPYNPLKPLAWRNGYKMRKANESNLEQL